MHGLERDDFQDEEVESALDEIGRLAHWRVTSVTDNTIMPKPHAPVKSRSL